MDLKINSVDKEYGQILQFARGKDCCRPGGVPGLYMWREKNRFTVHFDPSKSNAHNFEYNFELGTWYNLKILMKKEKVSFPKNSLS